MIKRIAISALALALAALPMSAMARTGDVSHFLPSVSPAPVGGNDNDGPDDEDGEMGDFEVEDGNGQLDEMGATGAKGEEVETGEKGEKAEKAEAGEQGEQDQ
jgi:hypothetical protein